MQALPDVRGSCSLTQELQVAVQQLEQVVKFKTAEVKQAQEQVQQNEVRRTCFGAFFDRADLGSCKLAPVVAEL
jgi:hypothetical protein